MNRYTVTEGSRRMIPAYPLFAAGIGIVWSLTPVSILNNSPVFKFVLDYVPNWVIGPLFIAVSVLLFYYAIKENREKYINALRTFEYMIGIWALVCFASVIFSGGTLAAWMWPAFVAYAARTSRKSLEIREVQPFTEPTFRAPS